MNYTSHILYKTNLKNLHRTSLQPKGTRLRSILNTEQYKKYKKIPNLPPPPPRVISELRCLDVLTQNWMFSC